MEINGYCVRQMLAPLIHRVSTIGKDLAFDYCLGRFFYPRKDHCALMCVSVKPVYPFVCDKKL